MPITLVSPMNDASVSAGRQAARLNTLAGKTVALLDITKPGGSIFLDRIESVLKERFKVGAVIREQKPTYTKPAPAGVLERLRNVDAVIEALAD
jgi:hypothetical protein